MIKIKVEAAHYGLNFYFFITFNRPVISRGKSQSNILLKQIQHNA